MTQYVHRIIIVAPVASANTVATWLNNNVGPDAVPADLGPGLNATGLQADAVTHRWCNGCFTDIQCRAILGRMCTLASVTPLTLAQWNAATGQQKRSWLAGVRAAVLSGSGIYVTLADNEGVWDDPTAVLAARGLKTIGGAA